MSHPLRIRPNPTILEIPSRPWLAELSRRGGHPIGFADVPDAELDEIARRGFDGIWLMGVWATGPKARALALGHPDLLRSYESLLPGWEPGDVEGSPYSIAAYEPSRRRGGREGLQRLRERLHERDLGLILDFVPNHLGIDHPWLDTHADRFVRGDARKLAAEPGHWFVHTASGGEDRVFAHGRDPYFPGWTDTVQLDMRRGDTRRALAETLRDLAALADGLRCDVAMLPLPDVFGKTWGAAFPDEAGDFWAEAIPFVRETHPDVVLMAEGYWGLGPRLLEAGFDWVYDKDLLEALLAGRPDSIRGHVARPGTEHANRVHFLENHDEARAVTALGPRDRAAAAIAWGLPGVRLALHGQTEGAAKRVPIQLGRAPQEPVDEPRRDFYETLLRFLDDETMHRGSWQSVGVRADGGEPPPVFASAWTLDRRTRLVAANFSEHPVRVALEWALRGDAHPPRFRGSPDDPIFESSLREAGQLFLELELPGYGVRLLASVD